MKNKIIIAIILVLAFGLIGTGLFFTFTDKDDSKKENFGEVVDIEEELKDNPEVHTENVFVFRTIEDAVAHLVSLHETDDVKVTYNDGIKATIKVFAASEEEIKYTYHISAGDLIINY